MPMLPFFLTSGSITVVLSDGPLQITASHPNYDQVRDALRSGVNDENLYARLMAPIQVLAQTIQAAEVNGYASRGTVTVVGRSIHYNGEPVVDVMTGTMLSLFDEGFDIGPWMRFMERLYQNPSATAVRELYLFLEAAEGELPLCEDGRFLAYKYVRDDYKDCYSGTFDNTPGKVCEVPRRSVDDNRDRTCSYGLHVCSWSYLPSYAQGCKVVMVAVDPADVVSVPSDYNNAKMRVCKYEVIADVTEAAQAGPLSLGAVVQGQGTDWSSRPVVEDDEIEDDDDEWNDGDDTDQFEERLCSCGDPNCTYDFDLDNEAEAKAAEECDVCGQYDCDYC